MEQHNLSDACEQETPLFPCTESRAMETPWNCRPSRTGPGRDPGSVRCHIVRASRDGGAAGHAHESQWGRDVILAGTEPLSVDGREVAVVGPGQTIVARPRTHAAISAGDVGLPLLAPALAH